MQDHLSRRIALAKRFFGSSKHVDYFQYLAENWGHPGLSQRNLFTLISNSGHVKTIPPSYKFNLLSAVYVQEDIPVTVALAWGSGLQDRIIFKNKREHDNECCLQCMLEECNTIPRESSQVCMEDCNKLPNIISEIGLCEDPKPRKHITLLGKPFLRHDDFYPCILMENSPCEDKKFMVQTTADCVLILETWNLERTFVGYKPYAVSPFCLQRMCCDHTPSSSSSSSSSSLHGGLEDNVFVLLMQSDPMRDLLA